MSDFSSEKMVTARKRHRCEACRTQIEIGEKHISVSGVYDGDFMAYRLHPECDAAMTAYRSLIGLVNYEDATPWLHEIVSGDASDDPQEDFKWLVENHPIAAERVRIREPLNTITANRSVDA